jgi:hypothetical protein
MSRDTQHEKERRQAELTADIDTRGIARPRDDASDEINQRRPHQQAPPRRQRRPGYQMAYPFRPPLGHILHSAAERGCLETR